MIMLSHVPSNAYRVTISTDEGIGADGRAVHVARGLPSGPFPASIQGDMRAHSAWIFASADSASATRAASPDARASSTARSARSASAAFSLNASSASTPRFSAWIINSPSDRYAAEFALFSFQIRFASIRRRSVCWRAFQSG
ncbi:MAG: hypothetical protein HMLKMBBP_00523 [Planctomycetes bacterium]|nr:hypothetical protein [Planctomycetota bacterium]